MNNIKHLIDSPSLLDGAILDGRLRIFFSQFDEEWAFKLYSLVHKFKIGPKYEKQTVLVSTYLYPENLQGINIPNFNKNEIIVKNKGLETYILVKLSEDLRIEQIAQLIKDKFSQTRDQNV